MLLVSGGHCQFLRVDGVESFTRLGGTIDDAPGEAFDKTAKLLGLGYPGGPLVEAEAKQGDATRFPLPRPLLDRKGCDMSFSGLKTALRRQRDALMTEDGGLLAADRSDLCASFQEAIVDVLVEKSRRAFITSNDFCTDNGAMIAWAGLEAYASGASIPTDFSARPRWPLDQNAAPMIGSGKKGAKA